MKRVDTMNAEQLAKALVGLSSGACMACPLQQECDRLDSAGLYDSGWRCELAVAKWLLEEVKDENNRSI